MSEYGFIHIFTTVFHRILDFKNGLDFYPGPFFLVATPTFTKSITFYTAFLLYSF
jgi:hypothetical protein